MLGPLACLCIGIALILFLILYLRFHAFLALIAAALVIAFLSDRIPTQEAIPLVSVRFGEMMGQIGLLLAFAAIIGKCLMDSGAADRVVRVFSRLFGEGRENYSLLSSGFVLSIPVFFDTVFYLLAPLARAVYARRKRDYVLIICATAAGGAITHALVPPTPGPIMVAEILNVSIIQTMMVGFICAIVPVAIGGIWYANWINKRMTIEPRDVLGISQKDLEATANKPDHELPGLALSLLPFLLPVVLLAGASIIIQFTGNGLLAGDELKDRSSFVLKIKNEVDPLSAYFNSQLSDESRDLLETYTGAEEPSKRLLDNVLSDLNIVLSREAIYRPERFEGIEVNPEAILLMDKYLHKDGYIHMNRLLLEDAYPDEIVQAPLSLIQWLKTLGDKNVAFLGGAVIGIWLLIRQKRYSFSQAFEGLSSAIASGAVIAFITCAGGSFGKALAEAGIGEMIADAAENWGLSFLILAYLTSTLIRVAQGSATVAMVTTAGIIGASLMEMTTPLPYNPVYLVAVIGFGATGFSWMNDSGFWIVGQMAGMNETQTLKTWTVMLTLMGITGFIWVYILSSVIPLV